MRYGPGTHICLRIARRVADADPVLLGRETEAVDGGTGTRRRVFPRIYKGQASKGVGLIPALFVGQLIPEEEVAPPEGFRLAPVPVEKLREQPLPALVIIRAFEIIGAGSP